MLFFEDDGPKSLVKSTLIVRIFPSTVISTFFMVTSSCHPVGPFDKRHRLSTLKSLIYTYSPKRPSESTYLGLGAPYRRQGNGGLTFALILGRLGGLLLMSPLIHHVNAPPEPAVRPSPLDPSTRTLNNFKLDPPAPSQGKSRG